MDFEETLVYVGLFIFTCILFPVLYAYMLTLDTSGWTFQGHLGVAAFLQVFPWIFLLAGLLVPTYMIVKRR